MFKEVEIQAIGLALDATKKEERESKFEIEKENAGQEDMEFEGGKTMRYEFEKLRVMLVSGEMRERERFFFLQSGMHLSAETVGFCRYGRYVACTANIFSSTKQKGYLYWFTGQYGIYRP